MARFDAWVARGYHAGMDYLVRSAAERRDPSLLLRDARSILVGAVRYVAGPAEPASPLSGEVAGYARGGDYHLRVGAMGSELATYLRTRFDARAAEYVDTGAILERLWAAHAGVGWIGKNALVLNRESGSYFFLAVVVTDLELPPDAPALDECGQCTLCIEACPTGAIVEPKVVDSRLCLSYHTIELRGEFPREHREAAGAHLFGCDECQTACPWNRAGAAPAAPGEEGDAGARLDLVSVLSMTLAEYTERFRGSAMKRATYHGLRRNAAINLGNALRAPGGRSAADPGALAALTRAAADPEPTVAEAASWALAAIA